MLEVLSYGGGVQSTAICLLILEGKLPKPDLILFSDTGSERPETYDTVAKISFEMAYAGIRFDIVSAGEKLHEGYQKLESLPMIGVSICTHKYKIRPIRRYVRNELDQIKEKGFDLGSKPWVNMWLGITTDEKRRVRDSDVQYIGNRYPLIEMNWNRQNCIDYLKNYPEYHVEKSGCFMCPYQTARGWNDLKRKHPELFDRALELEKVAIDGSKKLKGLYRSETSIKRFDHSHTLEDFGFDLEGMDHCDSQGGCFL